MTWPIWVSIDEIKPLDKSPYTIGNYICRFSPTSLAPKKKTKKRTLISRTCSCITQVFVVAGIGHHNSSFAPLVSKRQGKRDQDPNTHKAPGWMDLLTFFHVYTMWAYSFIRSKYIHIYICMFVNNYECFLFACRDSEKVKLHKSQTLISTSTSP